MRRAGDASWEIWVMILAIIVMAILPAIVGLLVFKVFRHFKPLEEPDYTGVISIAHHTKDGFFKAYLVGALICAPMIYIGYGSLLS